jgi:hypothetical protein
MQAQPRPRFMALVTKALLLIAVLGLVWALPAASSAFVRRCPGNPQGTGYGPRNDRDAPNFVSSVRNISCHAAGWGAVEHGYLTPKGNLRTSSWHCVVLKRFHAGSALTGADVRCARGRQAFRWTWGT